MVSVVAVVEAVAVAAAMVGIWVLESTNAVGAAFEDVQHSYYYQMMVAVALVANFDVEVTWAFLVPSETVDCPFVDALAVDTKMVDNRECC